MGLSDRVLVLHHGETIAMGPRRREQDPTVLKAYLETGMSSLEIRDLWGGYATSPS